MDPTFIAVSIVVAAILPVLIRFVKQEHFSQAVNGAIAVGVYVVAGALAVVVSNTQIDFANVTTICALFAGAGTVAYTAFWKNLETTPVR